MGLLKVNPAAPFSLPFTKDRGWPAVALPGVYIILQTSTTLRRTKCQLRLTRSGMPSRISLRRHWISPPLRAHFDLFAK